MGDLGQVRDARPIRHMAVTIKIRVSSAITEMNAQSLVVAESAPTNAPESGHSKTHEGGEERSAGEAIAASGEISVC